MGELDLATVPVVEAELAELWAVGFTRIELDLRGVTFLESMGLRLVWSWHERSVADGLEFAVIPGPPAVQRALELGGMAGRLTYQPPDRRLF